MRDKLPGPLHGDINTVAEQFNRRFTFVVRRVDDAITDSQPIKHREGCHVGERPLAGGPDTDLAFSGFHRIRNIVERVPA